ncbi:MAG: oligosaccharide flippase family protein [Deltaproteobacteria bacterium]|nr:oligosaccharide flippase family protein [Deltaproteobacteria bacterium]
MSLKKNIFANYLGHGWTALMGIAFAPVYIKYLGMEAYGLIGVFIMLQAWLALLDMGMTPTLNREMARYTAGAHTDKSIRDLLRSLEVICFAIAILIGVGVWLLSTWLGANWLRSGKLPVETVAEAISIMGFVVALRFVESLYHGAIAGLQKQVLLNVAVSGLATLRWAGAVIVLVWISPTIKAFFLWQCSASVVTVTVFVFAVYRRLPPSEHSAKFSLFQLRSVWRFASGMMATTLLALLLTQIDKVILSRLLTLEMFGYYMLAWTVAGALYQITSPITQAYYPRFTELVTRGDTSALISAYHQGAQLISAFVAPAAFMMMFFGKNLLVLWTGNAGLSDNVAPLLVLLALGAMLNDLTHIPYMLILAYGWTGFSVWMNIVAVAVVVPAILWVTPRYGAIGAAWIWVALNVGYVIIGMHFIHRRLLPGEKWRWYGTDLGLPLSAAVLIVWVFWYLQPEVVSMPSKLLYLIAAGLITIGVAAFAAPGLRKSIIRQIHIYRAVSK